jgi:hypothetical protein
MREHAITSELLIEPSTLVRFDGVVATNGLLDFLASLVRSKDECGRRCHAQYVAAQASAFLFFF